MPHYSQKNIFPMQGGCPCGHVRYQIHQAPLLVHCCHCTSCQRELGSAFAINAIIESDHVELLPSLQPSIPPNPAFARLTLSDGHGPTGDADAHGGLRGTVKLVTLPTESTVGVTVAQCGVCRCGVWAHYADAGPHAMYLRVGTLDGAREIEPDVHIFTRSKRDFVTLGDGKPWFEGYYGDREDFVRDECRARYGALKDKMGVYMAELRAAGGK